MQGVLLRRSEPETSIQRTDGSHCNLCRNLGLRVRHLNRDCGDLTGVCGDQGPAESEEKQTDQEQQNAVDRCGALQTFWLLRSGSSDNPAVHRVGQVSNWSSEASLPLTL